MYTPEERDRLRAEILDYALRDPRISGGAITGSAAAGKQDRWSDVDLAFGVHEGVEVPQVLADWTAHVYGKHQVLHHLDVPAGPWIYRVFLLPSTLQMDLALVPAAEFRALSPTFQLVFGTAREAAHMPEMPADALIGMGWLYALHARSCIARAKLWQAEYMISGVRDHALALACLRHGLSTYHGRGMDLLPEEATAPYRGALVREWETAELTRAFGVAMDGLVSEILRANAELGERLKQPLTQLAAAL